MLELTSVHIVHIATDVRSFPESCADMCPNTMYRACKHACINLCVYVCYAHNIHPHAHPQHMHAYIVHKSFTAE